MPFSEIEFENLSTQASDLLLPLFFKLCLKSHLLQLQFRHSLHTSVHKIRWRSLLHLLLIWMLHNTAGGKDTIIAILCIKITTMHHPPIPGLHVITTAIILKILIISNNSPWISSFNSELLLFPMATRHSCIQTFFLRIHPFFAVLFFNIFTYFLDFHNVFIMHLLNLSFFQSSAFL